MDHQIRVLISTHLGQPWGGIGTLYADLFDSRFAELVQLYYLDNHPSVFLASQSGRISQRNLFSALSYYVQLLISLRRIRPHVVHIATAFGLSFFKNGISVLLSRAFGARVVLAPHCSYGRLMLGSSFWRAYSSFIFRRCNGLIALSREWLAVKEELPNCLVEYLPNSIDLTAYRDLPRPRQGAGTECVTVLFLGHFGPDKGSFDLLEAAELLRCLLPTASWRVELRGEPARSGDRERLQQIIDNRHLRERVWVLPAVFGADKVACFAAADLFVLPSYHEGMPVSVIEAMASGLPVVATKVGGIPDLVTGGEDGLLILPGRPADLAQALAGLICDSERRVSMGLLARRNALERHDLDARVPDLVRFHQSVAMGVRKAPNRPLPA